MRNYLKELKEAGFSIAELKAESGLSKTIIQKFISGKQKLTSKSPEYEKIRNTSRRLSYRYAKTLGANDEQATQSRRNLFNKKPSENITTKQKRIKQSKYNQKKMYQLYLIGLFEHEETKERRIQTGHSKAYKKKKYDAQLEEAIRYAYAQLEGSNWTLIKILHQKYTEYYLI